MNTNVQEKPARIDFASIIGIVAGPGCILLGQALEGGSVYSLLQKSAFLIVVGATVGSCMLSFSPKYLGAAVRDLRKVISEDAPSPFDLIDRIVQYASVLRREGPVRLQSYAQSESYGMLATGLKLLVSSLPIETISAIMERTYHERIEHNNAGAEVFEAAAGYLPTFGILGAVIGLIHTMEMLNDPSKIGGGIATAFVATVYGVGLANLVAFPVAKKIRSRARTEKQLDKIVVTGIKAMREGMTAVALRQLLTEGLSLNSVAAQPQPQAQSKAPEPREANPPKAAA